MFKLKQVDKSFRDRGDVIHVARDLSWCVSSGESAALMGESGAGKTTIMNIIAGLDLGKVRTGRPACIANTADVPPPIRAGLIYPLH